MHKHKTWKSPRRSGQDKRGDKVKNYQGRRLPLGRRPTIYVTHELLLVLVSELQLFAFRRLHSLRGTYRRRYGGPASTFTC